MWFPNRVVMPVGGPAVLPGDPSAAVTRLPVSGRTMTHSRVIKPRVRQTKVCDRLCGIGPASWSQPYRICRSSFKSPLSTVFMAAIMVALSPHAASATDLGCEFIGSPIDSPNTVSVNATSATDCEVATPSLCKLLAHFFIILTDLFVVEFANTSLWTPINTCFCPDCWLTNACVVAESIGADSSGSGRMRWGCHTHMLRSERNPWIFRFLHNSTRGCDFIQHTC